MSSIVWIVLLVVAVVVVGAIAWWAGQRRRTDRLQERFGPEYERTVDAAGDKGRAEKELESRQDRVDALDIRPLDPAARDRYRERWQMVQARFVDDPASAIDEADDLIGEVMRERGYPVGDFEQRAADISVNHPQVVDHYRTAHRIAVRQRRGEADTEALRQAMVHYRALFSDLLDTDEGRAGTGERRRTEAAEGQAEAAAGRSRAGATTDADSEPVGIEGSHR